MSAKHVVVLISKADMVEDLERPIKHIHVMPGFKIKVSAGSVNANYLLMWLCSYP